MIPKTLKTGVWPRRTSFLFKYGEFCRLQHQTALITHASIYSFAVYVGSSIYSPTVPQLMDEFNISAVTASLGLALYVLAYGIGPMLFSPLSESVHASSSV
jgi:MFS family permease